MSGEQSSSAKHCSQLEYEDELNKKYSLEIQEYYTAATYNPLSYHSKYQSHMDNFMSGSFALFKTKQPIKLYRLYDGTKSQEYGQYWTLEDMEPNLATRHDIALCADWNSMTKSTSLIIPNGFYLLIGKAEKQLEPRVHFGTLFGGKLQVFIPQEQVSDLVEFNKTLREFPSDKYRIQESFQKTIQPNSSFITSYYNHKQILKKSDPNAIQYSCPRCGK